MNNTRTLTITLIVLIAFSILFIAGIAILFTNYVLPTHNASIYRDNLKVVMRNYQGDFTEMLTLLEEWRKMDTLDATWKVRLGDVMDNIQEDGRKLRALTPPLQYDKAHDKLVTFSFIVDNMARNMKGEWNLVTMIVILSSLNDAEMLMNEALVEIYGEGYKNG